MPASCAMAPPGGPSSTLLAAAAAVALLALLLPDSGLAHVALTFPEARKYDLDFLDNVRTKPPCGMPKGKETETTMSSSPLFLAATRS